MVALDSIKKGKAQRRRGRKGKAQNEPHEDTTPTTSIHKPHQTLLIKLSAEDAPTWYQCGSNAPHRNDTIHTKSLYPNSKKQHRNQQQQHPKTNPYSLVAKYRSIADSIYKQELHLFKTSSPHHSNHQDSKDEQWVENTMRRGTLKDRIAAMSVVVSTNPVHKLYALDMLLQLAGVVSNDEENGPNNVNGKGGGSQTNDRVSQLASEALTDLFTNTLLPSNRKLIGLEARPLFLYEDNSHENRNSKNSSSRKLDISPRTLLLWRYEEILKQKYTAFLTQYLGRTLSQSSGTSSLDLTKIQCLRTACSLLKDLPEGEQLLLTLVVNKIGDPSKKVAASAAHELRRIMDVHPNMMNVIAREVQQLAHRPNLSTRALYNCIIFLNQLKLVKEDDDNDSNDENTTETMSTKSKKLDRSSLPASLINTYFQIFEVAVNTNTKNKNLQKGGRITSQSDIAMKGRLLGALLTGVNRAHPYLPTKDIGMEQHVDVLYRIAHVSPPSACTQALMLLFHLAVGSSSSSKEEDEDYGLKKKTDEKEEKVIIARKDRFYRVLYSKLSDPSMFAGRQQTLFFNLLYKAMKYDDNELRVIAFGKRLIHISFHQCPSVISAALFLVSEVMKNQTQLESSASSANNHQVDFDPSKREPSAAFSLPDEVVKTDVKGDDDGKSTVVEGASLWEVALTLNHYHPTVSKFSSSLNDINYRGDPLRDFALAPFLDKFAFKNPKTFKKIKEKLRRNESIGERKSGLHGNVQALTSLPMNDPKFWREGNAISEQEEFFQKFFVERAKRDEVKGIVRGKTSKSVEDDAFDNEEGKDVDFDWETDDEEEAFVEKLAERLMEEESGGKANFDDEDPDMDDWSGYEGSDIENEDGVDFDASQFDGLSAEDLAALQGAEDDDLDEKNATENPFTKVGRTSDDDDDSIDEEGELGLALGEDDLMSDEDDGSGDTGPKSKSKSKNPMKNEASFADASEYEERINDSFLNRYASNSKRELEDTGHDKDSKRSRKKRRKKQI